MNKKLPFLGIADKAVEVYSKFTTKEIWDFINPGEKLVYEVRMKTSKKDDKTYYPRLLGSPKKMPYHWTGVFIKTLDDYEKCVAFCLKNKLTAYLSVNPKRKSFHGTDGFMYKTFNGKKQSELGIFNVFIDFDPTKKCKDNYKNTEEVAYKSAKRFLEENTNIKKYMLVCSGNGVQLRIPFDSEILLPKDEYDNVNRFIETKEIDIYSKLLKTAMSEITKKYSNSLIKIDPTGFELARVMRLPISINFKKDSEKFCGPIEIVDIAENKGLHDFVMSFYDKVEMIEEKALKYESKEIAEEFKYNINNIYDCKLVKFLLKDELPSGGRNNILFFQFKLLLTNLNIDLREEKIKEIVRDMERVQNHKFPLNECNGNFNPEAIINYCIEYNIKPIYPVLYYRKKKRSISPNLINEAYEEAIESKRIEHLPEEKNITRQILLLSKDCVFSNRSLLYIRIIKIMIAIINDYDLEKLEYLIDNNIFKDILEKT